MQNAKRIVFSRFFLFASLFLFFEKLHIKYVIKNKIIGGYLYEREQIFSEKRRK